MFFLSFHGVRCNQILIVLFSRESSNLFNSLKCHYLSVCRRVDSFYFDWSHSVEIVSHSYMRSLLSYSIDVADLPICSYASVYEFLCRLSNCVLLSCCCRYSQVEIDAKVAAYRTMLVDNVGGKPVTLPRDEFGRVLWVLTNLMLLFRHLIFRCD